MKTHLPRHPDIGLVAILILSSPGAPLLAAGVQHPVCAPIRDVGSVFGRGPIAAVDPHCLVERKVRASPANVQVSNVLGRGAPAMSTLSDTSTGTAVSAAAPGASPVERILGRSGTAIQAPTRRVEDTLVEGTQR